MNKKILLAVILLICVSNIYALTVVIDAGHGGKDPGAIGYSYQEKNINLRVAQLVGQSIKNKYPDVKVVYTRSTDVYLPLQERAAIANRANGDLFISIHTNACESHNAVGTETFTLGLAKTSANFEVAKRENSVMLLENDKEVYQGFDPNSPDSYIMFELMQSTYIDLSIQMADYVQTEFTAMGRSDRGVRQAGFWVLHQVKMPSVLVELGFITNASEEKYLGSEEGATKLANCIVAAFGKYKHEYDKKSMKGEAKTDTVKKEKTEEQKKAEEQKKTEEPKKAKNDTRKQEKKSEEEKRNVKVQASIQDAAIAFAADSNIITYRIQCFAVPRVLKETDSEYKRINRFTKVAFFFENNTYKYTVGNETSLNEARAILKQVREVFKDAFIVQFNNGTKVKIVR